MAVARVNNHIGDAGQRMTSSRSAKRQYEMPTAIVTLIDTALEDGDFEDAYATMLHMMDETYLPDVSHIQQLLALAIEPEACTQLRHKVREQDEYNPFVVSYSNIAERALEVLATYSGINGPQRLLQAVPRRISNEYLDGGRHHDDLYEGAQLRVASLADFTDDRDRKAALAEYTPLQLAAARIAECADVWRVLNGESKDELANASRTKDNSQRDAMRAWGILNLLCDAWQRESESSVRRDVARSSHSPSLLTQFKAAPAGLPSELGQAIRWAFMPFTDACLSPLADVSHRQNTGATLLTLLAELAETGKIDSKTFLNDVTHQMRQLTSSEFPTFVALALPKSSTIRARVCARYLQRYGVAKLETSGPPATAGLSGAHPLSPPKRRFTGLIEASTATNRNVALHTLLVTPEKAIANSLDRVPLEIDLLHTAMQADGGRKRVRMLKDALDATTRFSLLKIELIKLYIEAARNDADDDLISQWQDSRPSVIAAVIGGLEVLDSLRTFPAEIHRIRDIRTEMLAAILP